MLGGDGATGTSGGGAVLGGGGTVSGSRTGGEDGCAPADDDAAPDLVGSWVVSASCVMDKKNQRSRARASEKDVPNSLKKQLLHTKYIRGKSTLCLILRSHLFSKMSPPLLSEKV